MKISARKIISLSTDSTIIHLTMEEAEDLQEQLDDILGSVDAEPEPFTFTIPDIPTPTITWNS